MQDSYIKVPKSRVEELCRKTLVAVKEERKRRREEYLKKRIDQVNNGFLHKLFKSKDITKEEMIVQLEATGPLEEWYWRGVLPNIWDKNKRMAERLLWATQDANDNLMLLSTTDYCRISIL